MTTITKLSIAGIRSYADIDPQTIEFFKPLTIIVGPNGTGKTTIIEALKFATTGQVPPLSDMGRNFVHDPKMSGVPVVKAQIRLLFHKGNDEPAMVIRSFQLTQKAGEKREFKVVESVIRYYDDNHKEQTLSKRCADMDDLVPRLMGVSPAVLENVIFCHQEDSLWPLSDAKTLKSKFDDIFAATRYTKALEAIIKLRKEKNIEIKEMETELKVLEVNMDHAHKLEDDIESTKANIRTKTEQIKSMGLEIKTLESRVSTSGQHLDDLRKRQDMITSMESAKRVMMSEKKKAHDRIGHEFTDADEELEKSCKQFRDDVSKLEKQIQTDQSDLKRLTDKYRQSDAEYEEYTKSIGRMDAQVTDYHTKQKELMSMAMRIMSAYEIKVEKYDPKMAKDHTPLLLPLEQHIANKQQELTKHRTNMLSIDTNYENTLQNMKLKINTMQESMKTKYSMMKGLKEKLKSVIDQRTSITQRMGTSSDIQHKIRDVENELKNFATKDKADEYKERIDICSRHIRANQSELTVLSTEKKSLSSQADALTNLKYKRNQLESLIKQHNSTLESITSALTHTSLSISTPRALSQSLITSENWDESCDSSRIEHDLKKHLTDIHESVRLANEKMIREKTNLGAVQGQVKIYKEQVANMDKQLSSIRSQFESAGQLSLLDASLTSPQAGGVSPFHEELMKLNKKYEKITKASQSSGASIHLYEKFRERAQNTNSCPLCLRAFFADTELLALLNDTSKKIKKLEGDDIKKQVEEAKENLAKFKSLEAPFIKYRQLMSEREPIQQKLKNVTAAVQEHTSTLERYQHELATISSQEDTITNLMKQATTLTRLWNECSELHRIIKTDASRLRDSSGGARSLDEVQRLYDELERKNMQLNREMTEMTEKLDAVRNEKQVLVQRLNTYKERGVELSRMVMEKERLEKDEQEIMQQSDELAREVSKLEASLAPVQKTISESERERESMRTKHAEGERVLNTAVQAIQREVDQFQNLVEIVKKYESDSSRRETIRQQLDSSRKQRDEMKSQIDKLSTDITTNKELQIKKSQMENDILANLDYRKRGRELLQHQAKIDAALAEIKKLGIDEINAELLQDQQQLKKLIEKRSELRGALLTEETQCNKLLDDLKHEKYRQIDQRHKDRLIQHKTTVMANTDLETYYKALDKALMHFHAIKMREINEVLKEYWQSTYKGQDIDQIYILADASKQIGKRRAYNYRVMMKQGDTELEMRGRCSAGQKVLASLLIRLALAETFCLQCGVLCLDEPTTNLDHKNIHALAQAINEILNKRRDQRNFQLIVITHDEHFVDEIGKRSNADYYYRIHKDIHQHSKIRKQPISDDQCG